MRGRIVGGDSFDTEPAGAAGLAVLVKAHPTLQGNLVDFLEALPRDRLGPWACSGWEGVLKDPDTVRSVSIGSFKSGARTAANF